MESKTIYFERLGGPTYIGRPNGEHAREVLKLDSLDENKNMRFVVDIPETTYNINSSYFLGLFGDSVRAAGSIEKFRERFTFRTHGKDYRVIDRGIERALVRDKGLGIQS